MKVALSRVHFPVTTLGPGRRVGIWFQGCSIRCPGCISSDTWVRRDGDLEVDDLVDRLRPWLQQCDGVTISGGEPFEQSEALQELLSRLRETRATNVLVYSGMPLETLANQPTVAGGLIDCLISDPFQVEARQTQLLRGSDNQRLTCLTQLGHEVFGAWDRTATTADKRLDVMFDEQGAVWFAGIPGRGDIGRLKALLESEGTALYTTEARV